MWGRRIVFPARNVIEIEDFEVLGPSEDEVLVRSLVSGISVGTERRLLLRQSAGVAAIWNPEFRIFEASSTEPPTSGPIYPGYETVGVIEQIGSRCTGLSEGDLVWIDRPHASLNVVSGEEAKAGLLPTGLAPLTATLLPLTRVALAAVHDLAPLYGERTGVVGLGVVGILAARIATLSGATTVAGFDVNPYRAMRAQRAGVESYAVTPADDAAAIARQRMNGHGFDGVVEASGSTDGLQLAIRLCGLAGNVSAVSTYSEPAHNLMLGAEFHRNRVTIRSSMTMHNAPHRRADRWSLDRLMESARAALQTGAIVGSAFYDDVLPFEQALTAYRNAFDSETPLLKVALEYE